ncbi:hypothetical protein [Chryseobacterium sp. M5A1_1a]
MKKQIKLKDLKKLTRDEQKKVGGGLMIKDPFEDDGCGWNMCRNQFGRCSVFAC